MNSITKQQALDYHEQGKPGKIEIIPTKEYSSQRDLSLAYSPGVAYPCLEIKNHPADVFKYTNKGNLVGVISNGTAVLGLGDIGPLAAKPVMEGKALLFKIFAGLDAFDIELNQKDPQRFIDAVKAISPTFGGINLEDIKAPECFEIEKKLKEECDIPVMHDDQHGTAIISAAGLINALEIQGKKIEDVRLVVNGAGAAAISCTRLYVQLGLRREHIVMCDSHGVIRSDRDSLTEQKKEFATDRDIHTLAEAMVDADVFLGLSVKDVVTPQMLMSMAPKPIVFALANPDPEIAYDLAVKTRKDLIFATGRSDYPNQINNVLGFPYIFRGALDCGATAITEEMKIEAVKAIAALAKEPVPDFVDRAYGVSHLKFGPKYILPKALDPRLLSAVAPAVARGAEISGVATRPLPDDYPAFLDEIMGHDSSFIRQLAELARRHTKRILIGEGSVDNMLIAANHLINDKICIPVLLGNKDDITKTAKENGIDSRKFEIINPAAPENKEIRKKYAELLYNRMKRQGITLQEALEKVKSRHYFGMMAVVAGDADSYIAGTYSAANEVASIARQVIGLRTGYSHFACLQIVMTRQGNYILADTAINTDCDADTLVDVTRLATEFARKLSVDPVAALLSYSNFGTNGTDYSPKEIAEAVRILHQNYPEIKCDGEMQASFALDTALRDEQYPFNAIKGQKVNTLIFPDLNSSNILYRMLLNMGFRCQVGPIQVGLNENIQMIPVTASPREIENVATIAAVQAILTTPTNTLTP